jgi:small-conductance mechanosensitive channel
MQGILYEEQSFWLFVLITCLLGGGAAWISGRATAISWRGWPTLILSILGLGIAVRFIHHALFHGTMFTLHYYVVDTIVLLIIGSIGYQVTRAWQMTTQYNWLYERTGPMSWRPRAAETVKTETG